MKKERQDSVEVFNEQRQDRPNKGTEQRIQKLETSVTFLFGLFFGSLATKLLLSLFRFLLA